MMHRLGRQAGKQAAVLAGRERQDPRQPMQPVAYGCGYWIDCGLRLVGGWTGADARPQLELMLMPLLLLM